MVDGELQHDVLYFLIAITWCCMLKGHRISTRGVYDTGKCLAKLTYTSMGTVLEAYSIDFWLEEPDAYFPACPLLIPHFQAFKWSNLMSVMCMDNASIRHVDTHVRLNEVTLLPPYLHDLELT